jgi:glycosyltransferase involved in cell wall biosynthesis
MPGPKNSQNLKVAIFYDWLNQWGGAERVLLDALKLYPKADLFTLVHSPSAASWLPKRYHVFTSFINRLPQIPGYPLIYSPLFPVALEQFDFSTYDIVLSFTSTVGHCLLTPPSAKFFCYFFNLNRHIYQTSSSNPLNHIYRRLDQYFIRRPDYVLCDSQTVSQRISQAFGINPQVIYPGIDLNYFQPLSNRPSPKPYFLVVSRLVPYKKVDLAITACHQLNLPLKIVGSGREFNRLKQFISKLNNPRIQLLGQVDNRHLLSLYQHCLALIIPQSEDFGLTSLEAQACGKPVIAFSQGGQTETIINGKTGIFFNDQTSTSLKSALVKFRDFTYHPADCLGQASRFSNQAFMINLKNFIDTQL